LATQLVKLRRSATSGSIPTAAQLALGELALNTYDGKVYMKKNVGGTESVVEVGAGGFQGTSTFELYEYSVTTNQTTFSGSDDNSNTLLYDVGSGTLLSSVLVYLNGILLDYGLDYTATTGNSIVLSSAAVSGDLVSIGAFKHDVNIQGDISLVDNQQLKFGDDDDLRIYHDGSNTYINETGTGDLQLQVNGTTVVTMTSDGLTLPGDVEADEFIGSLRGRVQFKAQAGEALTKGQPVYISGISGNTPIVMLADANDAGKMPAFGLASETVSANGSIEVVTYGQLEGMDTSAFTLGDTIYVSNTAGVLTNTAPGGETSLLQNVGKVERVHASVGTIFVAGAGRTNAVPNLNQGNFFLGNASNKAVTADFNTEIANVLDTDGISLPDNIKAQFGAGNDLEIYNDGSNSYVKDAGTGDLYIQGTQLRLQSATGESFFVGVANGSAYVYHNGSAKLSTTATGVDVTGTIVASGNISTSTGNVEALEAQIDQLNIHTHTTTTTSTTQVEVCDINASTYRTSKFGVQITDTTAGEYHAVEILATHDGTTAYKTEYGEIHTGVSPLASFAVDISAGNLRLLATPASTNSTTFKVVNYSTLV
jgi:hypothetical protein